jgi:hypothetical protein
MPASGDGTAHPSGIELHAYASESWFTAEGARIKYRRLQKAGIPDLSNWRFVTLTLATRALSPLAAYLRGKDRIRRFLARFRDAIGREFRWCWKLEFHHDDAGYPHWHLLIDYTLPIPPEFLREMEEWWGLGRVNVRRVRNRDMRYLFKYVAKGPEELPDWVCGYKGRLRVFQACKGFYTGRKRRAKAQLEPTFCLVRVDLHTRTAWDRKKALLISTNLRGERRVRVIKLRMTFGSLLLMRAYESIQKRVQLAPPGVVNISQWQADMLYYEHRKCAGLAGIPANAAAA